MVARHDGRARNAAEARRRERRAADGHHVPARSGEVQRPQIVELGANARGAAAAAVHIVYAADGVDRALAAQSDGEGREDTVIIKNMFSGPARASTGENETYVNARAGGDGPLDGNCVH